MSESVKVAVLPPCDFCKSEGIAKPAAVDGKTIKGFWANMCDLHFMSWGIGLGTGRGQQLVLRKE